MLCRVYVLAHKCIYIVRNLNKEECIVDLTATNALIFSLSIVSLARLQIYSIIVWYILNFLNFQASGSQTRQVSYKDCSAVILCIAACGVMTSCCQRINLSLLRLCQKQNIIPCIRNGPRFYAKALCPVRLVFFSRCLISSQKEWQRINKIWICNKVLRKIW